MEIFSMDQFDELFNAVLTLRSVEECRKFFEDVCTIKEVQDMHQRLEVAKALSEGASYQEVCKQTGASTATISRVNKCLVYGAGGYRLVLDRAEDRNGNAACSAAQKERFTAKAERATAQKEEK